MHSSKSWRKNAAQNIVRAGWSAYSCEGGEEGVIVSMTMRLIKVEKFSNFSSLSKLDDTQHLSVDNISPPTGEYHHQRQLRLDRRVREFVEQKFSVIYVAKLAELFSRSRQRIPTRFRAHVSDIFLEKYSEEGDERDRVFVGGGMRGRVVHRV